MDSTRVGLVVNIRRGWKWVRQTH